MKKFCCFVTFVLLLALFVPANVQAAEATKQAEEVIYLDNGYYITVELTEIESRATNTKSGSKTYICRDSSGSEEWRIVLSGTFTYTGSSSTCTDSRCVVTVTDTDWYLISKSAGKSGSSATATVTMGRKFMGVQLEEETTNLTLTCDKNGKLS